MVSTMSVRKQGRFQQDYISPECQTPPIAFSRHEQARQGAQDGCFEGSKEYGASSPLFTDVTLSDTDSVSSFTTGDDLSLEKHFNNQPAKPASSSHSPQTAKRPRPELNIITHLPATQAKACGADVTVEQVQAKKAVATGRPKSIVSAKAEHCDIRPSRERSEAFARIRDLALGHRRRTMSRSTASAGRESASSRKNPQVSKDVMNELEASRAVMIGISVPQDEADLHLTDLVSSAITLETPTTPAIIVTPADDDFQLHKHSAAATSKGYIIDQIQRSQQRVPAHPSAAAFSSGAENTSSEGSKTATRTSERPVGTENAEVRHKSQGWWNLALSPMLSRAGTTKAAHDTAPEIPPIPDIYNRSRSNTESSRISPETPRRMGLAGPRASVWSHWTTEPRALDEAPSLAAHQDRRTDDQESMLRPAADQMLPRVASPRHKSSGLADEYYRATAIEQLSGMAYFECENHSCADHWPVFKSIYDMPNETPGTASAIPNSKFIHKQHESEHPRPAGVAVLTIPSHSRSTSFASDDFEFSPHVREAEPASIVHAKNVDTRTPPKSFAHRIDDVRESPGSTTTSHAVQANSAARKDTKVQPVSPLTPEESLQHNPALQIRAITAMPAAHAPVVLSPGPVSPEMEMMTRGRNGIQMAPMPIGSGYGSAPSTVAPTVIHNYYHWPIRDDSRQSGIPRSKSASPSLHKESDEDDEKAKTEQTQRLFRRLKACIAGRKAHKREHKTSQKYSKKRRCTIICTSAALVLVIVGAILLATLLTRGGSETPTDTQWLNLTGYPRMPTGISTIIRPDIVVQDSQCVQPATAWSCALPPEEHSEITPNDPDQPNFRFEIGFRNGTVGSNLTLPATKLRKRISNPFADRSTVADPSPPSRADQLFIGNTTDNNTEPVDGEETPFYISLIPAFPINPSDVRFSDQNTTTRLKPRQESSDLSDLIPLPTLDPSGLAPLGNLLPTSPYPTSQPLRFFNRGLPNEHFGFYIYYDRSIFLSTDVVGNTSPVNTNSTILNPDSTNIGAGNPSDRDGGVLRSSARSRCTFAQTRFLVQIFTNTGFDGSLNGPVPVIGSPQAANSAINYTPPGSFPYPTTITLDRHGGNVNQKAAYCYHVDAGGKLVEDEKNFILEMRGAGGELVNAAPSVFVEGGDVQEGFSEDAGGIDGGSGGCACRWQNWR